MIDDIIDYLHSDHRWHRWVFGTTLRSHSWPRKAPLSSLCGGSSL